MPATTYGFEASRPLWLSRYCVAALLSLLFAMCGCTEYSGEARVSDSEVRGAYRAGDEELSLNSDKTYVQVFVSSTKPFTNRGTWESSNVFLGGTEILLLGAVCSEDEPGLSSRRCSRNLVVHGRLAI